MHLPLTIYNTLERKPTLFKPLHKGQVGIYVCGPTVYGPTHLGNARSAIVFDVVVRTLRHLGYQVRHVCNITDVGHLMDDTDEGEDKVVARARLEQLIPMEVAERYMRSYQADMARLNVLPPSIAPRATGHMTEQLELVQTLLSKGFAYVVNGSVYFDVRRYDAQHGYGLLAGKKIQELRTGTRPLHQAQEKRDPLDFALWKKAMPAHLMQWPSPWGAGFPGWHAECTAMSTKYLGTTFDLHGGGIDLQFPHHECELAQSRAAYGRSPARYWMHNNLVTIKGKKMSKSADNVLTLADCLTGHHPWLDQAYNPMALRFFILQAHYRSTLDFSNEALQAAQKGYYKLMNGYKTLAKITYPPTTPTAIDQPTNTHIADLCQACREAICNDFHTAKVLVHLFDLLKYINRLQAGDLQITSLMPATLDMLKNTYATFLKEVLGLVQQPPMDAIALVETLLQVYKQAKSRQDYTQVQHIRAALKQQGIVVQDLATRIDWRYE